MKKAGIKREAARRSIDGWMGGGNENGNTDRGNGKGNAVSHN